MVLFDNGKLEDFLLFVQNFKMIVKASGMLTASAKLQYLCTILRSEALRHFDTLCAQMGSTNTKNLNRSILVLCTYFFPVHSLSKHKLAMRHRMRNP